MDKRQRFLEQCEFQSAQKWLVENGQLFTTTIESIDCRFRLKFKPAGEKNEIVVEGEDLLKLTIQLRNEVDQG